MLKVPGPLVSVEWLKDHASTKELVILDGTIAKVTAQGSEALKLKYIPNAQFFDIKKEFSIQEAPFPNTMISVEVFEDKAQKLGIDNTSCIVVYDAYGLYSAARVWWMFKTMGFENIAILDGGLPAWVEAGNKVFEQPFKSGNRGNFKAQYTAGMLHDHNPVLRAIDQDHIDILDARSKDRFLGLVDEPRKGLRSGHIPSSKSLPYASLLNGSYLKPEHELKELFSDFADKQLIFSCGTGITACVLAFGAAIAGIDRVSIYDGSWTEWGSMVHLPITEGS